MGGHGGLNILPQKRWNVYNRENRLKVSQDEAKAGKQEEEARRRHGQAEREHRRQLLLRRASGGDSPRGEVLGGGELTAAAPEHINFWKEEEAKLQHPENQKQQRDELKRRGNPDFYTSDAKFDAGFALGYGLLAEKPWYTQAQKPEDRADSGRQTGATAGFPAVSATHSGPRSLAQSGATAPGHARQSLNPQQHLLLKQAEQPEGLQGRGGRSKRDRRRGDSTDRSGASTSTATESSRDTDTSTSGSENPSSGSSSSSTNTSSSSSSSDSDGSRRRSRRRKRRQSLASRERRSRRGSKHRRKRRRQQTSSSDDDSQSRDASKKRKHRHSERSNSKPGSRRKLESKSKHDSDKFLLSSAVAVGASKSIEQLRAERLQREKEERVKQRGLLASTAVLPDGPPGKSYNSAYGFAAGLKRRRA
ncbi:hypothetical protein VaNZ11_004696, partial [Volvox africanus]